MHSGTMNNLGVAIARERKEKLERSIYKIKLPKWDLFTFPKKNKSKLLGSGLFPPATSAMSLLRFTDDEIMELAQYDDRIPEKFQSRRVGTAIITLKCNCKDTINKLNSLEDVLNKKFPVKEINSKYFQFHYSKPFHHGWFRIFGIGLMWKKGYRTFSQRNRCKKYINIFGWIISYLHKSKI